MKLKHLLPVMALAATTETIAEVNINGFATIAGGFTQDSDETFIGYTDDINYDIDSLLGIQISSDLDDGLSVTAQIIARGSEGWNADVEWAYVGYEANDNLKFLIGKQRTPFYMYSDFLDVGFAYHWITPPDGVYNIPVETATGVSAIYTGNSGELNSTLQLLVGRNTERALDEDGGLGQSDLKDLVSLSWTLNYDWFTFRASHSVAELSIDIEAIQPLVDNWRSITEPPFPAALAAAAATVADNLEVNQDDVSFSSIGFNADLENWQFVGEYTILSLDDTFLGANDSDSFYVSAAYRLDDVVFHATYGADEVDVDNSILNDIPPIGTVPALDPLIVGTAGVVATGIEDSNYYTLGLRWDFHPSAAFKVEYTDFTDDFFGTTDASLVRFAISTVF